MALFRFYLDVPFKDLDAVKQRGARWHVQGKIWYYDGTADMALQWFEQWAPRLYLDVPYGEKDDAKSEGAQWDANVNKWFIEGQTLANIDNLFQPWLPPPPTDAASAPTPDQAVSRVKTETPQRYHGTPAVVKSEYEPASGQKKPSSVRKTSTGAGNAKDATTLRISDLMTIAQLKEECQCRGIAGTSGKNKTWMLEQLGEGSVWQAAKMNGSRGVAASTKQSANATVLRISEAMTISQLKEECQFRGITGVSGKTKDWLLEQLGVGSIWQTEKVKITAKKPAAAKTAAPNKKHAKSKAQQTAPKKAAAPKPPAKSKAHQSTSKKPPLVLGKNTAQAKPSAAKNKAAPTRPPQQQPKKKAAPAK